MEIGINDLAAWRFQAARDLTARDHAHRDIQAENKVLWEENARLRTLLAALGSEKEQG